MTAVTQALNAKSILVGLALTVGVNLGAPYVSLMMRSQVVATSYYPIALAAPFLALVLLVNPALRTCRGSWALTGGELAVVFVMAAVACTIPTFGVAGKLLGLISSPRYLASPENRWAEYFFPYMRRWAVLDSGPALQWFYEGIPQGEAIPWGVWLVPVAWWSAFLGAGIFASLCIVSILRRQWMENERLAYPLAQMTTELIHGADGSGERPPLLRSWLFWVGFAVAFGMVAWNIPGYFLPKWPNVPHKLPDVTIADKFPPIPIQFYWPMLCVAFFLNREVSFSFWVFTLLAVVQQGLCARYNLALNTSLSVKYFDVSPPSVGWQSWGAMVAMVLLNLWVARRHLKAVFRKAWRPEDPCLDDSKDLMSSRVAVVGLIVCGVFMTGFLCRLGMRPGTAVLFLVLAFIGFLGLSRMVVEGGLVFILPPLTPQSAVVTLLGNSALGPVQLTAVGLTMVWIADPVNTFMPVAANAAKVGSATRASGRSLALSMGLAALVGLAVTVPFTIWIGYSRGAFTTGWLFRGGPSVPYGYIVSAIRSEPGIEWGKLQWAGIGAGLMTLVTLLHHRFAWWPLHPLGLAVGGIYKVRWCFLPFFVGWLAKTVIMRVSGAAGLRRAVPFFLGAMTGWFAGAALSILVDAVWFPARGHGICWH
ncbi:hypothetical protein HQ560_01615 [bacterium]|nr:hypothetical protein [bacterium]